MTTIGLNRYLIYRHMYKHDCLYHMHEYWIVCTNSSIKFNSLEAKRPERIIQIKCMRYDHFKYRII